LIWRSDMSCSQSVIHNNDTELARQVIFSSDGLPPGIDDHPRFTAWKAFLSRVCGPLEVSRLTDRPFSQRMEEMRFGEIGIVRLRGTMNRICWTTRSRTSRPPAFFLCLGQTPMWLSQSGRGVELNAETAAVGSCGESGELTWPSGNDLYLIVVPQVRLLELVAGAGDLVARPLQSCGAALRLLRRYLEVVPASDEIKANPDVSAHIGRTVMDLLVMTLGAEGDATATTPFRGLRAARLQQILAEIRATFADPAFSEPRLASRLGVTTRYIQGLLQETGSTFTDRVLELRLQRARAMLVDPCNDWMRIGEIAATCGFNEVPYFNRCFRRRFGTTPTQYRGSRT
jgi:AraC-like DNA-binding protein